MICLRLKAEQPYPVPTTEHKTWRTHSHSICVYYMTISITGPAVWFQRSRTTMFGSLAMTRILLLQLLTTVTVATGYGNQSTPTYETPGSFVECASWFHSSHVQLYADLYITDAYAIATVTLPNTRNRLATTSTIPAAHTSVSFVDYWCHFWGVISPGNPEQHPEAIGGYFYGLNASAHSSCLSLEEADYSSWAATASRAVDVYPPAWSPVLTPPCCDNFCDIKASAVQLFYWPTPAVVPNVTTFVDSTSFT